MSLDRSRRTVRTELTTLLTDEGGQDLTEYALLLAFVCTLSVAVFLISSRNFAGIWGSANSILVTANQKATAGS